MNKTVIVLVCLSIVAVFFAYSINEKQAKGEQSRVAAMVAEINKKAPIIKNGNTRIDSATQEGENTIKQYITLLDRDVRTTHIVLFEMQQLQYAVSTLKKKRNFAKKKYTIISSYSDSNSQYITDVTISPEIYDKLDSTGNVLIFDTSLIDSTGQKHVKIDFTKKEYPAYCDTLMNIIEETVTDVIKEYRAEQEVTPPTTQ